MPLRVNLTKAVLLPKVSTYIFTLHQTVFQPNVAVRPSYSSGSRNCKTSHRCLIINTFPPLPVPALSLLGAGRLIAFGADWSARSITWRADLLSLIFGWRIFVAILKLTHFTQGTFKVYLTSRLGHLAAVQFSFSGVGYLQQLRLIGLWI